MTRRCGQSLVASLFLLVGCADNPPVVIENKSVAALDVPPEVRQTNTNLPDYGRDLAAGPAYAVEPGDTLYSVAFRLGMDYRTFARLNNIDPPYVIRVGQTLRTAPDAALALVPAAPEANPSEGSAMQRVSETNAENAAGNATATAKSAAVQSEAGPPSYTLSAAKTPKPNAPVDRWFWPAEGTVSRAYSAERHKGIDLVGERGSPVMATAAGVVVYAGTGVTGYGELLIVKHNDTYLSAYGHNDALLAVEGQQVDAGQVIARMGSTSSDSVKLHFEIRRNGRPVNPTSLLPKR
jgi:lipoprotein NlpD